MSSHVRILGIAGSLRRGSYNQAALRAARSLVPENSEIDLFQLNEIPMFDPGAAKEFGGLDPPNFASTGQRSKPMILIPVLRETVRACAQIPQFSRAEQIKELAKGPNCYNFQQISL